MSPTFANSGETLLRGKNCDSSSTPWPLQLPYAVVQSLSFGLSWVKMRNSSFLIYSTCVTTAAEVELLLWGNLISPLRLLALFPNRLHCFCCFCYSCFNETPLSLSLIPMTFCRIKMDSSKPGHSLYPVLLPWLTCFHMSSWDYFDQCSSHVQATGLSQAVPFGRSWYGDDSCNTVTCSSRNKGQCLLCLKNIIVPHPGRLYRWLCGCKLVELLAEGRAG